MEFYEVINARRTIRDYENVSIDDDTMEKIISAGMKAPTNDHMGDWNLTDTCQQNAYKDAIPKQYRMLASIWCCIENMFLAAMAEDYLMPCFIAVGKPRENATYIKQKKYSLCERIHKNVW